MIDVDLQNLEIFSLLFDYFSLYHRHPAFGNPAVEGKLPIDASAWPVTGLDLRFFFVKPHLQLAESALPTAHSLIIEADDGLSVHVISDHQSWDVQVRANNLALVLLKSYQISTATIGLRGTAGSGLGIRTILDETSLIFSYHFNLSLLQSDIQLRVFPKTSLVGVDEDYFSSNSALYLNGVLSAPPLASDALRVGVDEPSWSRVSWSSCSQIVLSSDDFASLKLFFTRCLMTDDKGRPTILSEILPVGQFYLSADILTAIRLPSSPQFKSVTFNF
jgi:hypothetical protein